MYQSTLGKKVIVALTGLILFGFVVGHLAGNLQIFLGPKKLNDYSLFLRETKGLLWGTRVLLLVSVITHVVATLQLTKLNRASRPIPYTQHEMIQANLPSRVMIWSGGFLGLYVIYHLLHFTLGVVHPSFDSHDVYSNVVIGFSNPLVTLVYILAMVSLGFHLYHGLWSVFQTLGLNHPQYNCWRRKFAVVASVFISLGYISIPIAVLTGFLR